MRAPRLSDFALRLPLRALRLMLLVPCLAAGASLAAAPAEPGLQAFRDWLDREHPGYECDEGPAPFRNRTVDAAYPGQRFYYVLTYTRGIPPPYAKPISLVAAIDDSGRVTPFNRAAVRSYRRGLKGISSSKDAKVAAAAVHILASCDPSERRWAYKPDRFKVKRDSQGWKCTYRYDRIFESWVRFDRDGYVLDMGGSAPPVP